MASRKKPAAAPARPPVSMADLARELGVSVTTISRALSDHHSIGAAMKARVLALARQHNYQPNRLAAALRTGQSRLLGIVVPYIEGRFFPSVVHGIETAARKAGYSVIICQSNENTTQERRNLEALLSAQVAGILVSLARTSLSSEHFAKVRERGVPLVFFDRVPRDAPEHAVVLDDRQGGYLSTRHLLAQGCRRVAHLAGPQHLNIYHNRCAGYHDALREAGLPADESLVVEARELSQAQGAAALRQLLQRPGGPPDALFAAGDYCALGAMQEARRQGLRVPQELAISGFSNESFTLISEPQLTTIDQHCEEMGQAAVQLLLELLATPAAGPRQVVLPPTLLVRESSVREPGGGAAGPAVSSAAAARA